MPYCPFPLSVPSGGDGDIADGQQSPPMSDKDKGFMDDMKQNMAKNVGSYVSGLNFTEISQFGKVSEHYLLIDIWWWLSVLHLG